jgi:ABC-type lipoprotein export system ATPase subunit
MALLELDKAAFSSRDGEVVRDICISIEKGTVTALLGQSGCGKSTMLKLLAGLLVPSRGKLLFDGQNVATMTPSQNLTFRRRASFVFQDSALWANQDIYHILELPLVIHFPQMSSTERHKKIGEIVQRVEYTKPLSLRPASLSTGEQKKIAFARALICDPEILFLDECTESVDVRGVERMVYVLKEFCYSGKTIVYVSHDNDFIETFSGNKYYLSSGCIKETEIDGIWYGKETV